ncbi:MAG: glycerophosphodiester phosphodiesterase [Euzebyales bacterium]|nr:glycerophosphodiester phosphodiesterase [Euzebyales bacterium]MDQ3432994.1 glycerophosphodiester phosphodiesterase [Actinomycetota bacterium]
MEPFASSAQRPVIVGHRGVRGQGPQENTPAAFAAAAAAGAQWIELDARRSADGPLVVCHEGWTPDGTPVVDCTAAALRHRWGIVTLAEALSTLPAAVGVDLEVKNLPGEPDFAEETAAEVADLVSRTAAAVRSHLTGRPLLVSCFNPLTLAALTDELPGTPAGLITYDTVAVATAADLALEYGATVVCVRLGSPGLDAATFLEVHQRGLAIFVWTVNSSEDARSLAEVGADALCTDDPALVLAALAARSGHDAQR